MKQLSKTQSLVMLVGGLLMVLSAGAVMMATLGGDATWGQTLVRIVPWGFLVGAVCFVTMQRMQTYTGHNFTVKRLRSIQLLSGICFICAGLFMVENFYHLVQPFVANSIEGYMTYMQIVHNNWVVLMLVGAILQMYTAHRIASELQKES